MPHTNPRQIIAKLDRQIDAVRAELLSKAPVKNKLSACDWQKSWDRFPALRARDNQLFLRRGIAQLYRDQAEARAATRRSSRPLRKSKCPACGVVSYVSA